MTTGKVVGALPAQRILVTGAPRSATTFVGKVLSWPLSVDYLHEPFNPLCGLPSVDVTYLDLGGLAPANRRQVHGELDALLRYEPVLRTGYYRRDPAARRLIKPLIGSRGPFYLRLARVNPFSETVLLKDPFAAMAVEALIDEWGFRPVALIRHPIAFASSLDRLGWEPSLMLADIASQPSIVQRLHPEDREAIGRTVTAEWEAAAVLWRITTRELVRVAEQHPSVLLVTHEAVSRDAVNVFRTLYRSLGLPWSSLIEQRIERMTSAPNAEATRDRTQSFSRDSRALLSLRLQHLDEDLRHQLWERTESVASTWYEIDGVKAEAAAGLLPRVARPDLGGPDRDLDRPLVVHGANRPRMRVQFETAGEPTRRLTDEMVLTSCRRWVGHLLDVVADQPGDEVRLVISGSVGPGTRTPRLHSPFGNDNARVLMGVGWGPHAGRWSSPASRMVRRDLSVHYLHAVRDGFTRTRLGEIGVQNVVVTGCPTSWGIDPSGCRSTPGTQALVTLRHDLDDEHLAASLIALVDGHYDEVCFLPLHPRDRRFLGLLPRRWEVLPTDLAALDALLAESAHRLDSIGTCGHTGLRALEQGARALVIEGDPEVSSLLGPIGLPSYDRSFGALRRDLGRDTELQLKRRDEAIDEWLGQFLWAPTPEPIAVQRIRRRER